MFTQLEKLSPCLPDFAFLREISVDLFTVEDSYKGYRVGFDFQSKSVFANSDPVILAFAF